MGEVNKELLLNVLNDVLKNTEVQKAINKILTTEPDEAKKNREEELKQAKINLKEAEALMIKTTAELTQARHKHELSELKYIQIKAEYARLKENLK